MNDSRALEQLLYSASALVSFSTALLCLFLYRRTRQAFLLKAVFLFSSFFLMAISVSVPHLFSTEQDLTQESSVSLLFFLSEWLYSCILASLFIYGLLGLVFMLTHLSGERWTRLSLRLYTILLYLLWPVLTLLLSRDTSIQVFNALCIWLPGAVAVTLPLLRFKHYIKGIYPRERKVILTLSIINVVLLIPSIFFPFVLKFFPFIFIVCASLLVLHLTQASYFSPQIQNEGEEQPLSASPSFVTSYGISPREAEVLQALLAGKQNKAIADALCVSIKTVETHLGSLYRKTGTEGRLALFSLVRRG